MAWPLPRHAVGEVAQGSDCGDSFVRRSQAKSPTTCYPVTEARSARRYLTGWACSTAPQELRRARDCLLSPSGLARGPSPRSQTAASPRPLVASPERLRPSQLLPCADPLNSEMSAAASPDASPQRCCASRHGEPSLSCEDPSRYAAPLWPTAPVPCNARARTKL